MDDAAADLLTRLSDLAKRVDAANGAPPAATRHLADNLSRKCFAAMTRKDARTTLGGAFEVAGMACRRVASPNFQPQRVVFEKTPRAQLLQAVDGLRDALRLDETRQPTGHAGGKTIEVVEPRYKAPLCPLCNAKMKVASKRKQHRVLKCRNEDCGYTCKRAVQQTAVT